MSQQFKLPCPSCDQSIAIATTQAGESLTCDCGETIVVPTLREIRQLEPLNADAAPAATGTGWDPIRGGLFVTGIVLIAIGAYGHFRIQPMRNALNIEKPSFRELDFDVQTLTPMQAWEAWDHFRRQSLEFRSTPVFLANRERHRELSLYIYLFWGCASVGLALATASLVMPGRPSDH